MRGSRFAVAIAAAAVITLPASALSASTLPASTALAATGGHTADAHTVTTFARPPAAIGTPHTAKNSPVIVTCDKKLRVRPKSYLLACGDGSQWLSRLHWSSWTTGEATASGRFTFNTCTPNCAKGKFITSPVLVVLWRTAAVPHHTGQRAFMRMTVIYTGKRPAHSAQTFTERLWYPTIP
jgi:hypothetical protein